MDLRSELRKISVFESVPEDQLDWLIQESYLIETPQGEHLFKPGMPIDRLLLILDGEFVLKVEQNKQFRVIGRMDSYSISGLLPYSRANIAVGYAEALRNSKTLALEKAKFLEMITHAHELTTALVHTMSTRIREFTKLQQQNDKMMALGKLSAGLAHELNNPSAAVVRSAHELSKHLKYLPEKFKQVIEIRMTADQVDAVNQIMQTKIQSTTTLSMMEKSQRQEELLDWLDDHQVEESEEIAENFTEQGITTDDLGAIAEYVSGKDLSPVLNWINQVVTTEKLVSEIEEASNRINKLVNSVKSYTHMDQAPEKVPADIHTGLQNTLTMLNHKVRRVGADVDLQFDPNLPKAEILVSEMNQVWTNLIDNALDAMEGQPKKKLTIKTLAEGPFVNVKISDTGSGIPESIKDKIFDPFFTTKEIGKGTGLGLEVVYQIVTNQHKGAIYVDSKPGYTTFKVCIPSKAM